MSVKRKALKEVVNGDVIKKKLKSAKSEPGHNDGKKKEKQDKGNPKKEDINETPQSNKKSKPNKKKELQIKIADKIKSKKEKRGKDGDKGAPEDSDDDDAQKKRPMHKTKINASNESNDKEISKKDMREKQKKLKDERKKKKDTSVFDLSLQAKKVWNQVRGDDCPEEDRNKLLHELHSLVKGNLDKVGIFIK